MVNENAHYKNQISAVVNRLRYIQRQINQYGERILSLTLIYLEHLENKNNIVVSDDVKQGFFELIDAIDQYRNGVAWYKNIVTNSHIFRDGDSIPAGLPLNVAEYCKHVLIVQIILDAQRLYDPIAKLNTILITTSHGNFILTRWYAELMKFLTFRLDGE